MKKNKKINGKQIKLIINIFSLGIFIFSYFYLYEQYVDKTEDAYLKAESMQAAIRDREQKLQEEDTVRAQIKDVTDEKQKIIDSFPVYIADEDNFMFVEQMEKIVNVKTSAISTSDSSVFYTTILPIKAYDNSTASSEATTDAAVETNSSNTESSNTAQTKDSNATGDQAMMNATVNSLSMSFITDYKGLKEMADYINKYPDHTVIESIAVSADNSTGVLAGNLVLKRFALTGTGKEYNAPAIEGIDIGMDNIFGSGAEEEVPSSAGTEEQ